MNKFIIADLHLDDEAIPKYCRPQFCINNPDYDPSKPFEFNRNNPLDVTPETMKAHNDFIKTNWNRLVKKNDSVIILGDFAFNNHAKHLSDLNGKKTLVKGTHDAYMPAEALAMFEEVHEWAMMVGTYAPKRLGGQIMYGASTTMCHYPMRSWPGSCAGSCHLYGHSHGALQDPYHLMAFDVGIDVWGYIPIPWDVIVEKFRTKKLDRESKNYPLGTQDWTTTKQKNPLRRMLATREKNVSLLKFMGISFGKDGLVNMSSDRPNKIVKAIVAVAGVVNKHGIMYDEDALKRIADGINFFWDEDKKGLAVHIPESIMHDPSKVSELFKNRLHEVVPENAQ